MLGSLWIAGGVVATSLALAIMIGGIQGQLIQSVLPYIMAGLLCFSLSSYVLNEAPEVYMSAASIIKNHAHPYSYYSFESLSRTFFIFFHNLVAFYLMLALVGSLAIPHWSILIAIPVVYANSFLWGSLAAMLGARFRDMRFLLPFVGQMLFFLTPVFWIPTNMGGWRTALLHFNPFYGLLEIVRSPLLGEAPPAVAWNLSLISLSLGLVFWLIFFGAFRRKIAFWV
ncbi:ABC transporter permease [Asticcacaulis tiandongensis]|uniref:ABC transporter permease n=1 Tax=Asticcacaulis tiandongensis TaxID=2565365 RepID=UPI001FE5B841